MFSMGRAGCDSLEIARKLLPGVSLMGSCPLLSARRCLMRCLIVDLVTFILQGGALATLAAYDLAQEACVPDSVRIRLYTYEAPKVGADSSLCPDKLSSLPFLSAAASSSSSALQHSQAESLGSTC